MNLTRTLRHIPLLLIFVLANSVMAVEPSLQVELSGNAITFSSSAVAELDGDISNGKEIVVATSDSQVFAYHQDGSLFWSQALPNHACTGTSDSNKLFSSPAIGELFGDGVPYVVIGYGGIGGATCGGGVVAINGTNGTRRWHFNLKKFLKRKGIWAMLYAVFGTPALADVNGDGLLEVGFGSHDRGVYLLSSSGKVIWRYTAADTVWSSPAFADADNDGKLEMIIGTDITGNEHLVPPTEDGGILYALKTHDVKSNKLRYRAKEYYFRSSAVVLWRTEFDQTIMASPTVAEVLASNSGREIIIGSGCYFPEGTNNKRGRWFKIVSLSNGQILKTLPVSACSTSTPAVADLNEDGSMEVVVSATGNTGVGGDGYGRLIAFNPITEEELWSVIPNDHQGNFNFAGYYISPIIADIDGNGSLEVLLGNSRSVGIYEGSTGTPLTCQSSSCSGESFFRTGSTIWSTPTVEDLDYDGIPELLIGSAKGAKGAIYVWSDLASHLISSTGNYAPFHSSWSTYRGNVSRNGAN